MSNVVWLQFKTTWLTTIFSSILFCAVTYLLFWNENQAILVTKALDEASKALVTVDPYSNNVETIHEGKLIHTYGPIEVMEPLTEPDYNIQVLSVKLKKRVQMFQWIEEVRNADHFGDNLQFEPDINSYYYYTEWKDYLVDSNLFYISPGHHNPKDMPMSGQTFVAENVKIGHLFLSTELKRKFSDYYDITSDERPDRHDIKLHSGAYYHGADPLVHEVGDLRVIFSYAGRNHDEYTAVGILEHSIIQPYISSYSSEPIVLLRKGRHSAIDMLALEFRDANMVAWRYRAVGWFQMFAAAMSLHPDWFNLLLNCRWVSPRLRNHGRVLTNLLLATCTTLLIISLAWIVYSPIFSLVLIGIAIMPIIYFSSATQYVPINHDSHIQ